MPTLFSDQETLLALVDGGFLSSDEGSLLSPRCIFIPSKGCSQFFLCFNRESCRRK